MKNIKFFVSDKRGNYTTIKISEIGKLKAFDNKNKVYSFLVECDKEEESIHFTFYNSIHFTQERDKQKEKLYFAGGMNEKDIRSLIYDILNCIELDYNTQEDNLRDFLENFGYDYTKENEILFNRVREQYNKLHKVFTDEQILNFNENDDILKKYVDGLNYEKDTKDLI